MQALDVSEPAVWLPGREVRACVFPVVVPRPLASRMKQAGLVGYDTHSHPGGR